MLTRKYVRKVARLLDQTGEPRPGFLRDEKANLEGLGSAVESPALQHGNARSTKKTAGKKKTKAIRIKLDYEEDSECGDLRIVKRK